MTSSLTICQGSRQKPPAFSFEYGGEREASGQMCFKKVGFGVVGGRPKRRWAVGFQSP